GGPKVGGIYFHDRLPEFHTSCIDAQCGKPRFIDIDYHSFFTLALSTEFNIDTQFGKTHLYEVAYRGSDTSGHDIVFRRFLLKHEPHCFDIIFSVAPVAL